MVSSNSMDVVISQSMSGDALIIRVDGELDMYTAPNLKDALKEAIDKGHRRVVVDLTRVGFLDSTSLGVLVAGLRRIRAEEGDLHLVLDQPNLSKMFRITGFDGVFRIHRTLDEALGNGSKGSEE
ncbi:MAG: STAS domain-containing protein [Thermoleophilia bacterium]